MLENIPVLLLKKLVLLPYQEVRIELNNEISKSIIDNSKDNYDSKLLVICPSNMLEKNLNIEDLPNIGVLAKIKSCIVLPNGNYRISIRGVNRVLIKNYHNADDNDNVLEAIIKRLYVDTDNHENDEAIILSLKNMVNRYMELNPAVSNSVANTINNINDLDMLTDIITNFMDFTIEKKINYVNCFDVKKRAEELIKDITLELEIINIESRIDDQIREDLDKEQRDFIIKQKISKLNEELGINGDKQTEVDLFMKKIDALNIDVRIKDKFCDELKKYSYTSETNPDSSVIRNYLETVTSLPWGISSKDEVDIKKIQKSLDKTHFGMEEVKKRILEFIAIKKKNDGVNAPIICLVGPPGTGKTTLGISISKSLNREFYKISVGGLNDANELTGHKRTYLGSSPGKIIQGIKKCGTNNPLFLIDEVDKMVHDLKGDPAAVLLDILDPAQNNLFIDNYIEEPFDLSNVLFVLTANDIKSIPSALKDRLEIIDVSSYTENEKINIAKKYLIPNIVSNYNINKLRISDEVLLNIINGYTKESGVRELDRVLKKIYRNVIIEGEKNKTLTQSMVESYLGLPKYNNDLKPKNHVGSVSTLGVTPYGGVIINIESILTKGTGKIDITGNVEDSIKESINIGYNYLLSKAEDYKINLKLMNESDIHLNALNYALKKNGTSGGVAFTTSMLSLLLNIKLDQDICFTGEITLHGDICKVGGIKEKIIGAYNNDFKVVFIPLENKNDLAKVPKYVLEKLDIKCVDNYESIYNYLFNKKTKKHQ